ncbi:MAG: ABC transporter ATP-binding protein [Clostridiaceae bacterium]|nr:ABC transporter ATP-binding protein [Clostridiaceae bacterium]
MTEGLSLNINPVQVECRNLSYQVGRENPVTILKDISFTAANGEFIGVVGPNGAGKSTLLRQLGSLIHPTEGQVFCNGRCVQAYKPRELARLCTYMHQDTVIPFDFPARDVVMMGRHPYSSSIAAYSADDEAYVDRCMEAAGCTPDADKRVTALSGGERQRVMFARALAQNTPLLLLDEPTASLDIRYTNQVFLLVRELAGAGKLVIAVMHDLRAAAKYCSRLLLICQGRLIAAGDPEDVLHEGHIGYAFGIQARTFQTPSGHWDYEVNDL